MTNNQEKLVKQKIDKWLEGKGGTLEERERRSAAWMKYFSEMKVPKPVYLLAAVTWLCSGAVILPEDMPKVEQAVRVAEINHVDPLRYARPMEIIDAFPSTELKEAPMDPDTVSTLHLVRKFDSGLAIYDVDESEESRENMRRIINTHFGKESSPWCLLQGDGEGNLTVSSGRYWRRYSAYPKQVAFVDGKLAAFSANDNERKVWWNRKDISDENVVISNIKVKGDTLGRITDIKYFVKSGRVKNINIRRFGTNGWGLEHYSSLADDTPCHVDQFPDPNAKKVIIPEGVERIGNLSFYENFNVEEVYISEGVKYIGDSAFGCCYNLKKVRFPASIKKIDGFMDFESKALVVCIPYTMTRSKLDFLTWFIIGSHSIIRELSEGDRNALLRMGADEEALSLLEKDGSTCLESPYFSPIIDGDEHIPERIKGGILPLYVKEGDVFVCVPGAPEVTVRQFIEMAEKDPALVASACRVVGCEVDKEKKRSLSVS